MARQLANYSFKGLSIPAPYARVENVAQQKTPTRQFINNRSVNTTNSAAIRLAIYADAAVAAAAKTDPTQKPLEVRTIIIADYTGLATADQLAAAAATTPPTVLPPPMVTSTDFTTYFGSVPASGATGSGAASTLNLAVAQAYTALENSAVSAALFAGSTEV